MLLKLRFFNPACYWIFIVDRHFFLAPSFRTFLTGQIKYTCRLPKDFSGSWDGCPSNVKKLRGQRKRAQQKRQHGQAAQQAPTRAHPEDKDRGNRSQGAEDQQKTGTHRQSRPPQQFATFAPCSVLRSAPFVSWRSLAHCWYFWTNEGVRLTLAHLTNKCIIARMEFVQRVAHASYLPSQPWPSEGSCPLVLMDSDTACK